MKINTLDGGFEFKVQRFVIDENNQERQVDYFELTDQFQAGYFSDSLKEFAAYYSNRLSYEDNEELVTIPRQSRGLSFMSRSKRFTGVANAGPSWEPPKGGVPVTGTDLAVENVISGHCYTQPIFR